MASPAQNILMRRTGRMAPSRVVTDPSELPNGGRDAPVDPYNVRPGQEHPHQTVINLAKRAGFGGGSDEDFIKAAASQAATDTEVEAVASMAQVFGVPDPFRGPSPKGSKLGGPMSREPRPEGMQMDSAPYDSLGTSLRGRGGHLDPYDVFQEQENIGLPPDYEDPGAEDEERRRPAPPPRGRNAMMARVRG